MFRYNMIQSISRYHVWNVHVSYECESKVLKPPVSECGWTEWRSEMFWESSYVLLDIEIVKYCRCHRRSQCFFPCSEHFLSQWIGTITAHDNINRVLVFKRQIYDCSISIAWPGWQRQGRVQVSDLALCFCYNVVDEEEHLSYIRYDNINIYVYRIMY